MLLFILGLSKTTLLDVIAGYKTGGRITGDLTLSGVPRTQKMWQLLSGYAEQNDLLNPYLTVMETLKFTASCRLPASMDRTGVISNVVELMLLEEWVDYVIGVEKDGEGVPKHVRKRVTIAVQLVMLPKILFLDVRDLRFAYYFAPSLFGMHPHLCFFSSRNHRSPQQDLELRQRTLSWGRFDVRRQNLIL